METKEAPKAAETFPTLKTESSASEAGVQATACANIPMLGGGDMLEKNNAEPVSNSSADPSPRQQNSVPATAFTAVGVDTTTSTLEQPDDQAMETDRRRKKVDPDDAVLPATPSTAYSAPSSSHHSAAGDLTPKRKGHFSQPYPAATAVAEQEPPSKTAAPVRMVRRELSGSVSSDLSTTSAATATATEDYDSKESLQERAIGGGGSASAAAAARMSPTFRTSNVPPAPPSTPASQGSKTGLSFAFDGITDAIGPPTLGGGGSTTTPIAPLLVGGGSYVNNTDQLERLQRGQRDWLEAGGEVATPAPTTKPAAAAAPTAAAAASSAATPKPAGPPAGTPLPEDFSDWAVGDRYELVRILGRGSYGEVAQAIDLTKTTTAGGGQAAGGGGGGGEQAYVAIKRIRSPFDQQVDAVRLYREIHILRRMKEGGEDSKTKTKNSQQNQRPHDCIIRLMDVVQPPTDDLDDFHDLYLVFEYVDTDLYKLIMSPQYLTTEHIQTFLYQMLLGLKYIHSFSVIHRDLKPANILLNEDCSLKICDFGLARIVDSHAISLSKQGEATMSVVDVQPKTKKARHTREFPPVPMGLTRQLTKHVVTRWYRAPELILIQAYTSAVDIWSIGCIFAELLSMQEGNVPSYQDRKPLFPGGTCFPLSGEGDNIKADERLDQLNVIFSVIGTPPPEDIDVNGKTNEYIGSLPKTKGKPLETIYPAADPAAIDLLKKMLQFNPKRRVTAEEALEHDFFKGVRRKEFERKADGPLEGPSFLDSETIDLGLLKRKTYEEVLWYRDHGVETKSSTHAAR